MKRACKSRKHRRTCKKRSSCKWISKNQRAKGYCRKTARRHRGRSRRGRSRRGGKSCSCPCGK